MSSDDRNDASEDLFKETRMSFGDHLEDLRKHLWRAVYGFLLAMFLSIFITNPVLHIISAPVTEQLKAFHIAHASQVLKDLATDSSLQEANRPRFVKMSFLRSQFQAAVKGRSLKKMVKPLPEEVEPLTFAELLERVQLDTQIAREDLRESPWEEMDPLADDLERTAEFLEQATEVPKPYQSDLKALSKNLRSSAGDLRVAIKDRDSKRAAAVLWQLEYSFPLDATPDKSLVSMWVRLDDPVQFEGAVHHAQGMVRGDFDLTTLSVQEGFMAYVKVCVVCGLVLGSPWIFIQIWSFIAAGLYPHEKRLVNVYLPVSLVLFLIGVIICQVVVIPKAIEALLWFNQLTGMKPDLRFNEWLGFAIMMPVVFGISFQLPLVMMFLERLNIFTIQSYISQWRMAFFVIQVFSAVIVPSGDIYSMELLALPMFGLYWLGILMCWLNPSNPTTDADVPDSKEMVEV